MYHADAMDEGRKRVLEIIAGILMARHLDTADDLFGGPQGKPGEPVPEVDPDDLKSLWREQQEQQTHAVDMQSMKRVCKPGADVTAVWYRASQLWLLSELAKQLEH